MVAFSLLAVTGTASQPWWGGDGPPTTSTVRSGREARQRAAFRQLTRLLESKPNDLSTHANLAKLIKQDPEAYAEPTYRQVLRLLESHTCSIRLLSFALECGRVAYGLQTSGEETGADEENRLRREILAHALR
jgi:hypothetical protein